LQVQATVDPEYLIARIIRACQEGKERAEPTTSNLDENYSAQHLLKMAASRTLPEVSVFIRAARAREHGLALVRAGEYARGARLVRDARTIFEAAKVSEEVLLSAESFQTAAEAYVLHKCGEYQRAQELLTNAIKACHALRDDFGYSVEVRRVHLARNIVRVNTIAGNREKAMRSASRLVEYVLGDLKSWPFPDLCLTTQPDSLLAEEQCLLMDQILGEIALLVNRRNARSGRALCANNQSLFEQKIGPGDLARVSPWLEARRASVEGEVNVFLTHAYCFFASGPGFLRQSWREMIVEFVDLCNDVGNGQLALSIKALI
jgi:hypothetical protein